MHMYISCNLENRPDILWSAEFSLGEGSFTRCLAHTASCRQPIAQLAPTIDIQRKTAGTLWWESASGNTGKKHSADVP